MSSSTRVLIHPSQFPDQVRRDLLASLRTRRVNPKFHYDSIKQTQKWLALHQAFSPSRHDADCRAVYAKSFQAAAAQIKNSLVHLIGLGCGGGQKDTRLLKLLLAPGRKLFYTPSDVSVAMVLVARQTALAVVPASNCKPMVCDLATAGDLPAVLAALAAPQAARLLTFFGMIPNFEPGAILPKLAALLRADDQLLFSANLAPGADYAAGLEKILPQYDNPPTRDWLLTFLLDLGIERRDGRLRFVIENGPGGGGLKRVVAYFDFLRARRVGIENRSVDFVGGDSIRLFFSYRYTPDRVCALLERHGLVARESWITRSEEEGVFLVGRN